MLCGYDDFYYKLANMTAHTIRLSGYTQDIVIFTIDERKSNYAKCINLAAHPESNLIITHKQGGFFHRKLCEDFGHKPYNKPYDFFVIKTLPGSIIKKEDYDFILYMDSDMLVHSPLDKIFSYKTVVSDYNGQNAYDGLKGLSKYLSPDEKNIANNLLGIGGGAFGVPSSHYRFYDDYRTIYLQYINEILHDQPAMTMTMIRHYNDYKVDKLPNRAFWIHYWGRRKDRMLKDYALKYENRSI